MSTFKSIAWVEGKLRLMNQCILPFETKYIKYTGAKDVAGALRSKVTRGAPALAHQQPVAWF